MLPKVKKSKPELPGIDVLTASTGKRMAQEISQIGRNVKVMTRRKRTKKYASRPFADMMA
jgi:hypothetical protein